MFDWLKKRSLVREGLACQKERRLDDGEEWRELFEKSLYIKLFILLLSFGSIIKIGMWNNSLGLAEIAVKSSLFSATALFVLPLLLKKVWENNQLLLLFCLCIVFNFYLDNLFYYNGGKIVFMGYSPAYWVLPSVLAPMLCGILISLNAGFLAATFLSVLNLIFLKDAGASMFLSCLLSGYAITFFSKKIRRRSDIILAGLAVSLAGIFSSVLLSVESNSGATYLITQSIYSLLLFTFISLIVNAVLPIIEWMFDCITDITWIELTDLNHPLLKRLSIEAPGTYQHSLMVATLSEAAAEAIGANRTFCRAAAYFHDIGKLVKPDYFIENKPHDYNPHDNISPSMSALIIISHAKEGVALAIKHKLRQPIIDVIRQHHGRSVVYYFYHKALKIEEDAKEGGKILNLRQNDIPTVSEESFRYPGPIPQFKEAALISLADAIESASRSLKNPTSQKIETLVRDIVHGRIIEGELNRSGLTFDEVSLVIDKFSFCLKNMLHSRIEYPKKIVKDASRDGSSPAPTPQETRTVHQTAG